MSLVSIRAALETALDGMSPSISTAWENVPFTPAPGTAYQRVNLLAAEPSNTEVGRYHVERGILQVTLCYPLNTGPAAASTRAELIRSTFYRGASFTSGDVTVTVIGTPEIAPAIVDGDRYCIPVSVPFWAPVNS